MIPWDVVEAKIIDEHLIAVTFADGLQGKVYMGRLINSPLSKNEWVAA